MENLAWEIIIGFFFGVFALGDRSIQVENNTSGKQYKEAIGTQSRVTTTA